MNATDGTPLATTGHQPSTRTPRPAAPPRLTTGIDVEDVDRWRDPQRRLADLFTPDELAHARDHADPAPTYAGLWCAREAAYKALTRAHPDVGLRDLSIRHDADGRPHLVVDQHPELGASVAISISHTRTIASAVAVYHPCDCGTVTAVEGGND